MDAKPDTELILAITACYGPLYSSLLLHP